MTEFLVIFNFSENEDALPKTEWGMILVSFRKMTSPISIYWKTEILNVAI